MAVDVEFNPAAMLRNASLRVTSVRTELLQAVIERPHADVETLITMVTGQLGTVSKQAIYDALRVLTTAGLLRRIEPAGSPARYEARVGDNHHHVVCRICGVAGDVDCAVGSAPCLDPSDTHGFLLDEAEVTYWGTCPSCSNSDRETRIP